MLPYSLQMLIQLNKTTLWQVSALDKMRYAKTNAWNHEYKVPDLHIFQNKKRAFQTFW